MSASWKQQLNARNLPRPSAPLDVDQTDNAPSICSASQPCIKPRQLEEIKAEYRLQNYIQVCACMEQHVNDKRSELTNQNFSRRTHHVQDWISESYQQQSQSGTSKKSIHVTPEDESREGRAHASNDQSGQRIKDQPMESFNGTNNLDR
ncbi:hypothetical protein T265_14922, partial [Opisthorchis viverrini]